MHGLVVLPQAVEDAWAAAVPLPAEAQRALWSAELEGERALHWAETLPPGAAWAQLQAAALAAAAARLAASAGASLPPASAPPWPSEARPFFPASEPV